METETFFNIVNKGCSTRSEDRIGDAEGRIVSDEFVQFGPKFGKLFENQLPVGGIRYNEEILRRDDRSKTLGRMADEALPGVQNIEELLGEVVSAGRPEVVAVPAIMTQ